MSPRRAVAIAIGGVCGAALRWAAVTSFTTSGRMPWTVLAINALGSLVLGVLVTRDRPLVRDAGVIGFCGGLTTFSTFALEVVDLVRDDAVGIALAYAVLSVAVTVTAVVIGMRIARWDRMVARMGDLGVDTAIEQVDDNRYTAKLSEDWRIWGPQGGYIASTALRAAGAASPFARPASFSCHFLGVAAFDQVELTVTPLRVARTAASHRVELTQGGAPILEATVWSTGDVDGLEHDVTEPPDVPGPDELLTPAELMTEEELAARPSFNFWSNFVSKNPDFHRQWPPSEPVAPVWRQWTMFVPTSTFDDPWVDACRSLVLVDIASWPSASRQHVYRDHGFTAPTLDLYVSFHQPQPRSQWLLCDGYAPIARDGLIGWNGRLWSEDRKLVASGTGQMLCRRLPSPR